MKPKPDSLDLKKLYADCYKVALDPTADGHRKPDPMYFVISCKHGEIYPFSDQMLAVLVTSTKIAQRMKREHPKLKVHQDADDAIVFLFSLDQFDLVAGYVHPRKKRHLSTEHRELLRQVGFGGRTPEDSGFKRTVNSTSRLATPGSGVR
jgi:hypothetical protein